MFGEWLDVSGRQRDKVGRGAGTNDSLDKAGRTSPVLNNVSVPELFSLSDYDWNTQPLRERTRKHQTLVLKGSKLCKRLRCVTRVCFGSIHVQRVVKT